MIYPAEADIIVMLQHLIKALQPYATAQNIQLDFTTDFPELIILYQPEEITHDIISLLCRVISYTPEKQSVNVSLNIMNEHESHFLKISVKNTGINLTKITEIAQGLKQQLIIQDDAEKGTLFELCWPFNFRDQPDNGLSQKAIDVPNRLPRFYAEIRKRLRSHFTKAENLVALLSTHHPKDAVFLQKVNALILANLDKDGFNANHLSKALNMSRAQLYRRLHPLIRQAPAFYIRSIRIQKAKELLETTELNIGEVAFKTGFQSQSHFTKVFIEQFGVKPSLFRRKR